MNIQGRAAFVTGGSRGVGRATALALAGAGCSVAINYNRSREEAEEVAGEISKTGVKSLCIQGDVAEDGDCRRMIDQAAGEFGRLDILINNAGTTQFIPHDDLEAVTTEIWDRIFAVNVRGPFQCTRAARPHMLSAGEGEIVNVSSIAGIISQGSSIPYCGSKAALISMTVSLARALGPTIRVNSVAPGFIVGEWTRKGLGSKYESGRQRAEEKSVLGKVCYPEDIAGAILGIITGPDIITGQTVVYDAGNIIGPPGSMAR